MNQEQEGKLRDLLDSALLLRKRISVLKQVQSSISGNLSLRIERLHPSLAVLEEIDSDTVEDIASGIGLEIQSLEGQYDILGYEALHEHLRESKP